MPIKQFAGQQELQEMLFDVCVVGSGPAGLTICAELQKKGLSICVLESGDLKKVAYADVLRDSVISGGGVSVKARSRERIFGGTSTTWAGLSAPLDPIDFEKKAWNSYTGWPIGFNDLVPYWDRASRDYGFPSRDSFLEDHIDGFWEDLVEKKFIAQNQPKNFGASFRSIFYNEKNLLVLNATVIKIITGLDKKVSHVVIKNSDGIGGKVFAKFFVLAAGGIENSRMLLVSNIGNEQDVVGRFFMNHPKNKNGVIIINKNKNHPISLKEYFGVIKNNQSMFIGFRAGENVQRAAGILNSYIRFEPIFSWSDSAAVEGFVFLVKKTRIFLSWFIKKNNSEIIELRDYSETGDDASFYHNKNGFRFIALQVLKSLRDFPKLLQYLFFRFSKKAPELSKVRIRNFIEMEPDPDNRITLSNEKDVFGTPKAVISASLTKRDKDSLDFLHNKIAYNFEKRGLGIYKETVDDELVDASHHMGGVRMGIDKKTSVVDSNLKVHEIENLFIAGSSVFPTSGCANPTYTIVALSIRLADYLNSLLKKDLVVSSEAEPSESVLQAKELSKDGHKVRVTVIGSGRRVLEDVIPVVSLSGSFELNAVYAKHEKKITVLNRAYGVRALASLCQKDLDETDLLYIAVSRQSMHDVVKLISKFKVGHIQLIVDTPGFRWADLLNPGVFRLFKKVVAAEDVVFLPWISLLHQVAGKISKVVLDKSGYEYHGVALLRALINEEVVGGIFNKIQNQTAYRFDFDKKGVGILIQPRNYATGTIMVYGENGCFGDGVETFPIQLVVKGGYCVGFGISNSVSYLREEESMLIGEVLETDTIVTKMLEIKRVGLLRLLESCSQGGRVWSLEDSILDVLMLELPKKLFIRHKISLISEKISKWLF